MGTKRHPGAFDCHKAAAPDEPLFTLLARDDTAPYLVQIWALMRLGAFVQAAMAFKKLQDAELKRWPKKSTDAAKAEEAGACALAMIDWKASPPQDVEPFIGDGTSDAALAIGEDAFRAGFEACYRAIGKPGSKEQNLERAWSNYNPPEDIKALS